MNYLNEISLETENEWLDNFNNYPENIFKEFQTNQIILPKAIYNLLSNDLMSNINLYFGINDEGNPKIIAVSAYELDAYDGDEPSFADILEPNQIFELYSGEAIDIETARNYVSNWVEQNQENPIFIKSNLIPHSNLIKFFVEDNLSQVLIFFGLDNENKFKVMQKHPDEGDLVLNYNKSCPPNFSEIVLY